MSDSAGAGSPATLLRRLVDICVERGCREMFVLTDEDNVAAMASYRKAGGSREPDSVLWLWSWPKG